MDPYIKGIKSPFSFLNIGQNFGIGAFVPFSSPLSAMIEQIILQVDSEEPITFYDESLGFGMSTYSLDSSLIDIDPIEEDINDLNSFSVPELLIVSSLAYEVTYNGNGNTGGSVPVDSSFYALNANVTVLGNTGSLVKTGNSFEDWNTASDGSGTSYDPADVFQISGMTTLYAQWELLPVETSLTIPSVPTVLAETSVINEDPVSDQIELSIPSVPTISVDTSVDLGD